MDVSHVTRILHIHFKRPSNLNRAHALSNEPFTLKMIAGFPAEDSLIYLSSPESGPSTITSQKVHITSNFFYKQTVLSDPFSTKF